MNQSWRWFKGHQEDHLKIMPGSRRPREVGQDHTTLAAVGRYAKVSSWVVRESSEDHRWIQGPPADRPGCGAKQLYARPLGVDPSTSCRPSEASSSKLDQRLHRGCKEPDRSTRARSERLDTLPNSAPKWPILARSKTAKEDEQSTREAREEIQRSTKRAMGEQWASNRRAREKRQRSTRALLPAATPYRSPAPRTHDGNRSRGPSRPGRRRP